MDETMTATTDRPLITFALFAYNQEKYIREAVEGAFSQTYEPLEIILSDDCSSDRTFEIMQEMAAAYKGPHKVIVRQNKENIGIIDHVLHVVSIAKGSLIVVAAGDDISLHNRVSALAKAWKENGSSALYSSCTDISDSGEIVREKFSAEPLQRIQVLFAGCKSPQRYSGLVRNIPGYSAAYVPEIFAGLPNTGMGIHNEDALTTYIANLEGREITFVDDILMKRRMSETSISAFQIFSGAEDVFRNERVVQKFAASTVKFLDYLSRLKRLSANPEFSIIMKRLDSERDYLNFVASFWSLPARRRIMSVFGVRDKKSLKFFIPRIAGLRVYAILKLVSKRLGG